MKVGSGSTTGSSLLNMLLPWKIGTALSKWIIVLLLLPRHLPTIHMDYFTLFRTNTPSSSSSSSIYVPSYSYSSVIMVVDAEKVANPTDQFDIDDSFLRVTIRHQTFHEIPSCQHRITQIELHNLHTAKELVINSIQMMDEVTKLLMDQDSSSNSNINNHIHHHPNHRLKSQSPDFIITDLPQQLYMSQLPAGGELRLGPGQVAFIPVAFLPRFPLLFQNEPDNIIHAATETSSNRTQSSPPRTVPEQSPHTSSSSSSSSSRHHEKPTLSPYERADWEECMDNMKVMVAEQRWDIPVVLDQTDYRYYETSSSPSSSQQQQHRRTHRNNLQLSESPNLEPMYMNERFRITSAIIINTNRGNFHCPFEIVSRRHNLFGLPDFVVFNVPDSVDTNSIDSDNKSRNSAKGGVSANSMHSLGQDDEMVDEDERRIKETIELFRAVKELEKWTLSHTIDYGTGTIHSENAANSSTQPKQQRSLGDKTQQPLELRGRANISARVSSARVVDRIVQQSHNDPNPPTTEPKFTTEYDCYDLYLRNPDPTMVLKVSDILLSKSKLINLYVIPDQHNETFVYTHPSHRHINDWSNRSKPIFGKSDGSLIIPGDGEHHYLVTMCAAIIQQRTTISRMDQSVSATTTNVERSDGPYTSPKVPNNHHETFLPGLPDWIDIGNNGIALGFLQIKTSQGTLFVSLVKSHETMRRHSEEADYDQLLHALELEPEFDAYEKIHDANYTSYDEVGEDKVQKILATTPESIDFTFITSSLPSFEFPIDIGNISPNPLTIMRLAVVLDDDKSTILHNNTTKMSLNVGDQDSQARAIDLRIIHVTDALSKPLHAGSVVSNATTLLCSVDWSQLLENSPARLSMIISGALVIRGTSEHNMSYVDWLGTLKTGHSNQSNFVVEIPLTIQVEQGTVGFLVESTSFMVPSLWSMKKYSEMLDIVSAAFFPYHPSLTTAILSDGEKESLRRGYLKGADHRFRIFNDVGIDLELSGVDIVDNSTTSPSDSSLCERFDTYIVERGPSEHIDLEDLRNMGLVHVRYRYPDYETYPTTKRSSKANLLDHIYPVICTLQVTTDPPSGIHAIDFVVYDGQLDLTKNSYSPGSIHNTSVTTTVDNRNWYNVLAGLDNVLHWFRSTKAGFSLRSVLQASADRNNDIEKDTILLSRYLYRLAQIPFNPALTKLKPVLLSVGGLEQGESMTVPLYITNYNPVPIKINIAVGGVEGQSISLGRRFVADEGTVKTLLHRLFSRQQFPSDKNKTEPRAYTGRFRGHPVNGLRDVLLTNKITQNYFQKFGFRDDVSVSHLAVSMFPDLKKIYSRSANTKLRASLFQSRPNASAWNRCDDSDYPPTYGEFQKRNIQVKEASAGPIVISSDRKAFRRIKTCWNADDDLERTEVLVPPGGVARFDVSVRAPARVYLPKDITQFVATGLILTTDHGEVIPLLLSFKALRGGLELSPATVSSDGDHREIHVPIKLFSNSPTYGRTAIKIPPQSSDSLEYLTLNKIVTRNVESDDAGLSIFAKSSFSRDLHLRRIDSCNSCFSVDLERANVTAGVDPFLGVHIGAVRSTIPCNPIDGLPRKNTSFPSFFRCALDWLTLRGQLQPRGCGNSEMQFSDCSSIDCVDTKKSYDTAVKSIRNALLVSEWWDEYYNGKYTDSIPTRWNTTVPIKSGRRNPDGIILPCVINAVADALKSLDVAAKSGHLTLGSNLRAVVDYSATPDEISPVKRDATAFLESNQTISLAIDKTVLISLLTTPQLLNHERLFEVLHQSGGRQRIFFPPTAFGHVSAIKIPIRNPTDIPIRVRLGVGRRQSMTQFEPPYIQQFRKRDALPLAWANEQWWDRGGAFFQADFNGNVIRSPYNVSVKSGVGAFISTMNPSVSSNVAFLNGCGPRCGIIENDYGLPLPVAVAEISPIGAAAAAGEVVSGRRRREFNTDNDRRQTRFTSFAGASFVTGGQGPTSFALPYSAIDEIIVPPFGEVELGPILFRPPGRTKKLGCDAITSKRSSSICKSQAFTSTIFIENSLTGIEEVSVEGKALWEKIVFLSPNPTDGFDDIELRHGYPTLTFSSMVSSSASTRQPSIMKEVVVWNEGDVPVAILNVFWSTQKWNKVDFRREVSCEVKGFSLTGCNESDGLVSFKLLPGQKRSIYIEYSPSTSRKRTYVMLNFELDAQGDELTKVKQGMLYTFQNIGRLIPRVEDSYRRTISLSIGHETIQRRGRWVVNRFKKVDHENKRFVENTRSKKSQLHYILLKIVCFVVTLSLVLAWFMLVGPKLLWFRNYANTYYANLVGLVSPPVEGQSWRAMFRSLARVNPATCDMQLIGRDQTRHMVLVRLKLVGAIQPQCFSSSGVPKRERAGTSGSAARQVNTANSSNVNKSTVNEKVRMSDAIFGRIDPSSKSGDSNGFFPVRLGWRCAAARGIIDSTSLQTSPIKLMTEDLLRRRTLPIPSRIQAVIGRSSFEIDSSSSTSGLDSSLGDLSVDENLPNDLPEIVSYDREMASPVPQSVNQVDVNKKEGVAVNVRLEKNEMTRGELHMHGQISGEHHSSLDDDAQFAINEMTVDEKVPINPTAADALRVETGLSKDVGNVHKNEATLDDQMENVKAIIKIPVEGRTSTRSATIAKTAQTISKSKSPTKKERTKVDVINTGNVLAATNDSLSHVPRLEKVKSSDDDIKNKTPNNARSKSKTEKKGRSKGAMAMKTSPSLRVTKTIVTDQSRLNEGSRTSNEASLSTARLPPKLLPPPGFNEDLTSLDRSQNASLSPHRNETVQPWIASNSLNAAKIDTADASYPMPTIHTTLRELTRPPFDESPHVSQLGQGVALMEGDPLLTYNKNNSVLTPNHSYGRLEVPKTDQIAPEIISYGSVDLDITQTSTATSPMHSAMAPGLSSLVPSFSIDNDDQSNNNNNNHHYGTSSSMMDFDVMDFLDQILEEGHTESGIDELHHPTGDGSNTGMILNNIVPMASINPWSIDSSENSGTSYHANMSSRAAAYGIAFDYHNNIGSNHHRYMSFPGGGGEGREDANQSSDSHNDAIAGEFSSPMLVGHTVGSTHRNDDLVPLLTPLAIATLNYSSHHDNDDTNRHYNNNINNNDNHANDNINGPAASSSSNQSFYNAGHYRS